ncbi:hypothetical protein GIB67_042675 [Kingdonia uniflora]|uniref:Cytochrome b5 heme-binding domain-containing protein n=1 Tax=Kingdonia uniflora TaxID=39325 RepID=A0A7J7P285_9MAGN|nr:hypothetical protein GIB67_042675 [Kingdonia uniflora]
MTNLETKKFSYEDIFQHNTKDDCWIIIDTKVYDITSYLDDHPGGDDVLLNATGRDAKEDFELVGHSDNAREIMQGYCIGELDLSSIILPKLEVSTKKQIAENSSSPGEIILTTIKYEVSFRCECSAYSFGNPKLRSILKDWNIKFTPKGPKHISWIYWKPYLHYSIILNCHGSKKHNKTQFGGIFSLRNGMPFLAFNEEARDDLGEIGIISIYKGLDIAVALGLPQLEFFSQILYLSKESWITFGSLLGDATLKLSKFISGVPELPATRGTRAGGFGLVFRVMRLFSNLQEVQIHIWWCAGKLAAAEKAFSLGCLNIWIVSDSRAAIEAFKNFTMPWQFSRKWQYLKSRRRVVRVSHSWREILGQSFVQTELVHFQLISYDL